MGFLDNIKSKITGEPEPHDDYYYDDYDQYDNYDGYDDYDEGAYQGRGYEGQGYDQRPQQDRYSS